MAQTFTINEELFLLKHPFYQAWMEGRLLRETLQDYAEQYFHHVRAFPEYLKNSLNLTADPAVRSVLAENLAEEDGTAYGTSHPELWLRFAEGVGTSRERVEAVPARAGIQNVVETFGKSSSENLAEALGSLYAYESQVPEIAGSKIEGLKKHFAIQDERTLAFFEVHKEADVQHRESLRQLIESLPVDQQLRARKAADRACQALWDFLSDVHEGSECH